MSDLLRWFGEQSETVKLTLLAMLSGIGVFFGAIIKEWRKPVLNVPVVPVASTTPTAPRSADDPIVLLLNEVAVINVNLAEILAATRAQEPAQNDRIETINDNIEKLTNELYLLRNILTQRNPGVI